MPAQLIVYFPLADPAVGPDLLTLYAEAGVDVVECGWPARAPYLDGPDVRAAMARAGDPAAAWADVRARLSGRARPKPLLMTYAEPGHPGLADESFFAGAYGLIAVAPAGEATRTALEASARRAGAAVCAFLPLPLSEPDVEAARRASGYVMLQAAAGLTGPRAALDPANAARLADLRVRGVVAPLMLGFGVSTGEQARAARDLGADGVVVGSAALRAALRGRAALAALLHNLRRGLDG
jgi:tryptophan synthase alpha chain